jgi:hypothetical protein
MLYRNKWAIWLVQEANGDLDSNYECPIAGEISEIRE